MLVLPQRINAFKISKCFNTTFLIKTWENIQVGLYSKPVYLVVCLKMSPDPGLSWSIFPCIKKVVRGSIPSRGTAGSSQLVFFFLFPCPRQNKQTYPHIRILKNEFNLYSSWVILNDFTYLFLERREGREEEGEKHWCERYIYRLPSHSLNWKPGLQPRHVPSSGIKLGNLFWFGGRHPTHWATPVRAKLY